jgi:two-component system, NarL family, invasion response regulator UvrY
MHSNTLPQKIKIALADDHTLLREALAGLINSFEDYEVVITAGNGKELTEILSNGPQPHIILLDLNMPVMDGFATLAWLKANRPNIITLMLTMYDSEASIIRLLRVGVKGFLKKDSTPSELLHALRIAINTGYYYSHVTSAKLAGLFQNNPNNPMQGILLTDVETEFIRLCCSEITYKQIAGQMNITPRVAEKLRDDLFTKLDVRTRVGLALYAIKHGIVTI